MDDRKNKQAKGFEVASADFASVIREFCDASVLVCVSYPEGPEERTSHFVATSGNPYAAQELADLYLDGRLSPGATWVGPSGTIPAGDVYEDPDDPDGPAFWPSTKRPWRPPALPRPRTIRGKRRPTSGRRSRPRTG